MPRYSKKAGNKVSRAMHEKKKGTLKSGRSGKKVTSRKQAIAIGLSEARKEGAKVPKKKSAAKKKSATKRSSPKKKSAPKKAASKKRTTAKKRSGAKKSAPKKKTGRKRS